VPVVNNHQDPDPATSTTASTTSTLKRDLTDVSPQAICSARTKNVALGTFSADPKFGLGVTPVDLSTRVMFGKTGGGSVYDDLELSFTYPDETVDGVRHVSTGYWEISVKTPKAGVELITPGAAVDVSIVDMGKLSTPCTNEPSGGGLEGHGPGDNGKLTITERTKTSLEGTLERTLSDGTVAKLVFRAPIIPDEPATSGPDTVCCMAR